MDSVIQKKTLIERKSAPKNASHVRTLVTTTNISYYFPSEQKPSNTYLSDRFCTIPVHAQVSKTMHWEW